MKNQKLLIVLIVFGVLVFVVGRAVGKSVGNDHNSDIANVARIQGLLEDNCNCEGIEKSMYAKGVQYTDVEDFTTEKVDFILTNCTYDNLNQEGARIAKLLNKQGLGAINMITLEFVANETQETVTIRNGKIE